MEEDFTGLENKMSDRLKRIWIDKRAEKRAAQIYHKNILDNGYGWYEEFISKETADKDIEKILQPIRDVMKKFDKGYTVVEIDYILACTETLALADKE
jgi:hypothetical protein